MTVEIRRGTSRFTERAPGRATSHAFSFGAVYDPAHVSFGPMVCHDEHLLGGGRGFEAHRHADLEIVTWVVSGAVRHVDSAAPGSTHTLVPGEIGHLRAGAGVEHSEVAAAPQTRFVQVWLLPAEQGREPAYRVLEAPADGSSAALTVDDARLHVLRLPAGGSATLPAGPLVHAYVAAGALLRNSLAEPLAAGDALLVTDEPGPLTVTAAVATELLVWVLPAAAPAGAGTPS